jgi:hypothetical protein
MTRLVRALLLSVMVMFSTVTAASAQTNTGPNDYPPSNGAQVKDFGLQRTGATFTKEDCGFAPGSTAQIALNGKNIFTKPAESDGCVRLAVEIQNKNKVRIDGTNYDANRCAENTITVSGTHRNGGTISYDNKFKIDCATGVAPAGVARTGAAHVTDLSVAGAGLVFVGVVLAIVARRRRSSTILAEA